jgi:WD40 repeat protein
MNSVLKRGVLAWAAAFAFSATASSSWAQYALTNVLTRPATTLNNSLRSASLTDVYLFVGSAGFSRPGTQGQIFQFDATGENLLRTLEDPLTRGFQSLTFGGGVGASGQYVVAGDTDISELPRYVHVFDADTGALRHTLESPIPGHLSFASRISLGDDSVIVGAEAIGVGPFGPNYPARIFIFDAASGALRHTLGPPDDLAVNGWGGMIDAWGDTIAIGSTLANDVKVLLYDARTGQRIGTVQHPQITDFDSMQLQGDKLLLGKTRGNAYLVDTAGNLLHTFNSPGKNPEVSGAYFRFAGDNILIASFGSLNAGTTVTPEAWVYDGESGELIQRLRHAGPSDRFFSVAGSPSGSQIAIVRGVIGSHIDVLVYTKVPEPAAAALAAIAVAAWGLARAYSRPQ